ncbi:hypothetical protein [Roseinatronobacter sp.]
MKAYEVKPGVEFVNGQRVTSKTLRLSEAEARFDLDHGRIRPLRSKGKKPDPKPLPEPATDG